jgi:hypothetical protein
MNYDTKIGVVAPKDGQLGHGYGRISTGHPTQGKTSGDSIEMYQYPEIGAEDVEEDIGEESDFDDPNRSGRKDVGSLTGRNATRLGISEERNHTTTAVKGINPKLTYRKTHSGNTVPPNSKGPALGVQSNAKYIRSAPGRIGGTQYGTSRAPLPRADQYDDRVFSLFDLADPMERSFIHQQKRVNKIKNMVNSIEKE